MCRLSEGILLIMNNFQTAAMLSNWNDISEKLDYCKKHSSKETYGKVVKSFRRTALSIVFICIIYAIVLVSGMIYFDKQINTHVNENNISYNFVKTGHIRSGELYYIDNEKYEVDMADYGYNITDYESGTDFNIYLDENHKVIDICLVNNEEITASDKMVYWLTGSLIGAVLFLIVYTLWLGFSKSILNPAKEWCKYGKWLKTKDLNEEWYYG